MLNLHSDSTALQLARNTLHYYGIDQQGLTETMNELGLSAFVMGARIGFDPNLLINKMKVLIRRAGTNFLILDGHHCLEKTTFVETINSMMLQSVDGILYLFPCWIDSPASFTRLRAKGAFIVSADYDGKQVVNLNVLSERGGICRINNPWQNKRDVKIVQDEREVDFKVENGILSFLTEAGEEYELTCMD